MIVAVQRSKKEFEVKEKDLEQVALRAETTWVHSHSFCTRGGGRGDGGKAMTNEV